MFFFYQLFIPLLSLFLNRVDLIDFWPIKVSGQVLEVYDGDTVKVKIHKGEMFILRLSRIDAPEKNQYFWKMPINAGLVSTQCLKRLLMDRKITWEIQGRDRYGRLLGDALTEDHLRITLEMIKQGCAILYPFARFKNWQEKHHYLNMFLESLKYKRGLWKYGLLENPYHFRRRQKAKRRPVEAE